MRIETDTKLGFKDVLIRPKRSTLSSRGDVVLQRTLRFRHSGKQWSGVPVMAANMDTVGTFEMAAVLAGFGMFTVIHKHYTLEKWAAFCAEKEPSIFQSIAVSTGTSADDIERLHAIMAACPGVEFICIDVANGYSEHFVSVVRQVRKRWPDKVIIAGNVVTGEMVEELILSGADIVKVGIGPGSVCLTRVKTGVGYPQLSAIIECADAAHGLGGHIIGDGGCSCPGDVCKAFGAGADFVMMGGMFAGHDECGCLVTEGESSYVEFYGMSSATAMDKHSGGVNDYRASEGKAVRVPYRGPVETTVKDILGGIRSACTYVGAQKLKEFSKRCTFVRVMEQESTMFD